MFFSLILEFAFQSHARPIGTEPVILECNINYINENFLLLINPQSGKLVHIDRNEKKVHISKYELTNHEILYHFLDNEGRTHEYGMGRKSLGLLGTIENGKENEISGYGGCSIFGLLSHQS
jgi:hypothetical protein